MYAALNSLRVFLLQLIKCSEQQWDGRLCPQALWRHLHRFRGSYQFAESRQGKVQVGLTKNSFHCLVSCYFVCVQELSTFLCSVGCRHVCLCPINCASIAFRSKFRILDAYGTEVMFNVLEYATSHDLKRSAGMRDLNIEQFFTMYRKLPNTNCYVVTIQRLSELCYLWRNIQCDLTVFSAIVAHVAILCVKLRYQTTVLPVLS